MVINTAANQIMPPINIPIDRDGRFDLSISPTFGMGASGLTGGFMIGGGYSNGDFSVGAGIGVGSNYWGWNSSATFAGYGIGLGQTTYGRSEVMGQEFGKQSVGTGTVYFNHNSLAFSNDAVPVLGDGQDRWRTNAIELNIGRFSVGSYLYTNWGKEQSGNADKIDSDTKAPLLGKNNNGTWKNGRVYFAPAWVGYRNGNQITRVGFSHKGVQNLTQNLIHKYVTPTPYFLNYDEFKTGGYFYTGYYNPLSLWDR